jgi:hypothetical protein
LFLLIFSADIGHRLTFLQQVQLEPYSITSGSVQKMEMNHVEMNILEQQAREANADSVHELDDLRLMLVGGGGLAVNFG